MTCVYIPIKSYSAATTHGDQNLHMNYELQNITIFHHSITIKKYVYIYFRASWLLNTDIMTHQTLFNSWIVYLAGGSFFYNLNVKNMLCLVGVM